MKYIFTILIILGIALLSAVPTYYPNTVIVEDFAAIWCVTCLDAFAGLDVLDAEHHVGEQFSVRHFTTSADLSNPEVDARFEHYQVFGVPAVFFNGKFRVDGGGEDIADGSTYLQKLRPFLYHGAPMKIDISSWQNATLNGTITMVNANQNVNNQNLRFLLMEDNVQENATAVVRSIATQSITINGVGSVQNFSHSFTLNPAWNPANLWAAVFVQMNDNSILQAAHTKALPQVNLRAAMDWDIDIVGPANTNFLSQPFYFFNLGIAQDYQMQIVVEDAPADWYFNYCDEEGFCYPGSVQLPLNLAAGEQRPYHLNLMVGSSGIARFYWEVTSDALGTFKIPFSYTTDDVSNSDATMLPAPIRLGNNYPNPFASSTTITIFSDKANSNAGLEVFNLRGQKVHSVKLSGLQSGSNAISINLDSELPNGIYYYRLAGSADTRKMLLFR